MSPRLTRLIGQTGLYALATAAIKASGLFLAPILLNTAFLSQGGYGQLEVLLVTAQLGIVITGMGIGWGLLRYLTDPSSEDDHAALPFTSLLMIVVCASLALAVFVGGAPLIDRLLFGDGELTSAIRILGAYIFVKAVGQIPYMVLRAREHVGSFVTIVVVEVIALVGLVYVFLVVRGEGLHGVLYAYLLAATAGLLLLTVFVLARIDLKFNRSLVKRIFFFGAPLVA
ncbi:MAG: oligosaccharide flippase family protein, partial [Rhodothermales bacterium]|nr:oligosaccharide flippase family protein [Rhodothermales bacterium]